jgi:hypothetical protein
VLDGGQGELRVFAGLAFAVRGLRWLLMGRRGHLRGIRLPHSGPSVASAGVSARYWPTRCRIGAVALVSVIVSLTGCDGSEPKATSSEPADTRAACRQAALSKLVAGDDVPGCAAAIAERGVVVWQGA